jgi:hypothetical protein
VYKNLSIAVLLVAFGLVAARSTGTPSSTSTSPTIVKKVTLPNQTGPINGTIFTPVTNGLFRVSVYMTQTVPGNNANNFWGYNLAWFDDAGSESTQGAVVQLGVSQAIPFAWGSLPGVRSPGNATVIEAIAGHPVTFSVDNYLGTGSYGTYSLYFAVERLI